VAVAAAAGAFVIFVAAGLRAGWRSDGSDALRWGGVLVALVCWAAVLLPWRSRWSRLAPADHQRGMYRALAAWAVTDLVVVLAWGT